MIHDPQLSNIFLQIKEEKIILAIGRLNKGTPISSAGSEASKYIYYS